MACCIAVQHWFQYPLFVRASLSVLRQAGKKSSSRRQAQSKGKPLDRRMFSDKRQQNAKVLASAALTGPASRCRNVCAAACGSKVCKPVPQVKKAAAKKAKKGKKGKGKR